MVFEGLQHAFHGGVVVQMGESTILVLHFKQLLTCPRLLVKKATNLFGSLDTFPGFFRHAEDIEIIYGGDDPVRVEAGFRLFGSGLDNLLEEATLVRDQLVHVAATLTGTVGCGCIDSQSGN